MKNKIKIEQLENKNQFIIKDNQNNYFQSYDSLVAIYNREKEKLTLGKDWNYSKTTLKHLYIFIDNYCYIKELRGLSYSKNKRKLIQSLIDKKIIKYDLKLN